MTLSSEDSAAIKEAVENLISAEDAGHIKYRVRANDRFMVVRPDVIERVTPWVFKQIADYVEAKIWKPFAVDQIYDNRRFSIYELNEENVDERARTYLG